MSLRCLSFVGYQSVQNLLPDALLVIGGDAFLTPFLNGGKAMLEGVNVAWRSALSLHSRHTRAISSWDSIDAKDSRDSGDSIFLTSSSRLMRDSFIARWFDSFFRTFKFGQDSDISKKVEASREVMQARFTDTKLFLIRSRHPEWFCAWMPCSGLSECCPKVLS